MIFDRKDINYSFLNNIREEYDRGIFNKTPYVCFELIVDISDQNSYHNNYCKLSYKRIND